MRQVLLLLVLATLPACLTSRTRSEVVLPAARSAWQNISLDVLAGIDNGGLPEEQADELRAKTVELTEALASGDMTRIRSADWLALVPWAERGIQHQLDLAEIGPGGAVSLRERVNRFSHLMGMLQDPIVFLSPSSNRTYWVEVPGVESRVYAGTDSNLAWAGR
jgi:hypothetical protein